MQRRYWPRLGPLTKYVWHWRLVWVCVFALGIDWTGHSRPCGAQTVEQWTKARNRMVDLEVVGAGIHRSGVIAAMRATPRHEFVPPAQRQLAYLDMALPIGEHQTISTPFMVALMTEQIEPQIADKVLEIGTGSGYQAAVLSGLVPKYIRLKSMRRSARARPKRWNRLATET